MEDNNREPKQDNNNKNNKSSRFNQTLLILLVAGLITILGISCVNNFLNNSTSTEITYTEFINMINANNVAKVVFNNDVIEITPRVQPMEGVNHTFYTGYIYDEEVINLMKANGIVFKNKIEDKSSSILDFILVYIVPWVLIYFFFSFMIRRVSGGGGVMGVGKSNAKVFGMERTTGITFADVAGQDEAKESLTEIVDFLHNPAKYVEIGAKLPKGALLVGPPGTGKTLLAKAVAGEAGVPFFSLSGSDFVEMFVGVGASRVRDLFKQAQQAAPCIIFIDEIDAIGKSRDSRYGGGGNDEREQTLNQLLAEMDGFDTSKGLLVLAATNRPEVLDKALLRPGRFDRRIIVDRPDLKGRVEILKVHSKNVNMDDTVDLDAIALATAGAVGSDLANMINEACINAVKNGRKVVNQKDLFESVEVVIAGKEKKDRLLSPQEKRIVAYHEVGHALVTTVCKNAEPVQKITIVPRTMGSLGYTLNVPEEEKYLSSKEDIMAKIYTFLGGRAAEEVVFNSVTTGASNDIERATKLVRDMITMYGMSERFGLMGLETVENQYLDGRTVLNCSDETAAAVDDEVKTVLKDAYAKVKEMIIENRDVLDKVAEYLIEKETITGKEFMDIYKEVKGISDKADEAGEGNENAATDVASQNASVSENVSADENASEDLM